MSVTLAARRVNLGSGKFPLDGWTNVDAHCPADIQVDFNDLDFFDVAELRMTHVLEHVGWRETVPLLIRIRGWMLQGAMITVEVPDMDAILALGTRHPLWFKYVYGDQSHDGEYHRAGFTAKMLAESMTEAGWQHVNVLKLVSTHPGREGMPCLEATARA